MRIDFIVLFVLFFTPIVFAQTTQWRLVWNDINNPTEITIDHYNIYRNTENTISIDNTTPVGQSTETNFIDTTVQPGVKYYYWVTSVDNNGEESDTSRSADATIPNIVIDNTTIIGINLSFTMLLDDYVNYFPSAEKEFLIWEILTQHNDFSINYDPDSRKLELKAPSIDKLTEKLILKVTTNPGFYDIDSTILLSSVQPLDTTIFAYPIPFNSNLNGHEHIEFSGLNDDHTIYIFDLLGRYVYKNSEPEIPFKWNVINNFDAEVRSGVYIYLIKDKNEKKVSSGKLIIIR